MSAFPTGTVTLVFTDIEDSSRLWEVHRQAFRPVLEEHHRLIRHAAARWHGYEVNTAGDGFFLAFARVSDAIRFAIEAQLAMRERAWSSLLDGLTDVRVRIGLNTGEPLVGQRPDGGPDYAGPTVNLAARVGAAGHGGQIVLSAATHGVAVRELVAAERADVGFDADIEFQDLGIYHLKGVGRERLFQVCHPRLPASFPQLRAASTSTLAQMGQGSHGALVPKLCNRRAQESQFSGFFTSHLKQRPGAPQAFVTCGEEGECHDSLVERLVHEQVVPAAARLWGDQRGVVKLKKLDWPHEGELPDLIQQLERILFQEFEPAYMGEDLSARALCGLPLVKRNAVLVLQHNLHAARWRAPARQLFRHYLEYWGDLAREPTETQILLFLNVLYPAPSRRMPWKLPFLPQVSPGARVRRQITEILSAGRIPYPCLVLHELHPPERYDVEDWFVRFNVYDAKTRQEASASLFGGKGARPTMAEIEHELGRIHRQFLSERGFD